jgi:hypothetical protein
MINDTSTMEKGNSATHFFQPHGMAAWLPSLGKSCQPIGCVGLFCHCRGHIIIGMSSQGHVVSWFCRISGGKMLL